MINQETKATITKEEISIRITTTNGITIITDPITTIIIATTIIETITTTEETTPATTRIIRDKITVTTATAIIAMLTKEISIIKLR